MNVFWNKAIGHTSTSGDHGVAFEWFCTSLVHLVQFFKMFFGWGYQLPMLSWSTHKFDGIEST